MTLPKPVERRMRQAADHLVGRKRADELLGSRHPRWDSFVEVVDLGGVVIGYSFIFGCAVAAFVAPVWFVIVYVAALVRRTMGVE